MGGALVEKHSLQGTCFAGTEFGAVTEATGAEESVPAVAFKYT